MAPVAPVYDAVLTVHPHKNARWHPKDYIPALLYYSPSLRTETVRRPRQEAGAAGAVGPPAVGLQQPPPAVGEAVGEAVGRRRGRGEALASRGTSDDMGGPVHFCCPLVRELMSDRSSEAGRGGSSRGLLGAWVPGALVPQLTRGNPDRRGI